MSTTQRNEPLNSVSLIHTAWPAVLTVLLRSTALNLQLFGVEHPRLDAILRHHQSKSRRWCAILETKLCKCKAVDQSISVNCLSVIMWFPIASSYTESVERRSFQEHLILDLGFRPFSPDHRPLPIHSLSIFLYCSSVLNLRTVTLRISKYKNSSENVVIRISVRFG